MKTLCSIIAAASVLMSCTGPAYASVYPSMHQGPYALVVINLVAVEVRVIGYAERDKCATEAMNIARTLRNLKIDGAVRVQCVPARAHTL